MASRGISASPLRGRVPEPSFAMRVAALVVANAIEPGRFDLAALDELRTPGLTVFAVLPGPWSARHILTAMHRAALTLADRLDGEVLDGRRAPLTAMSYQALLDELPAEA